MDKKRYNLTFAGYELRKVEQVMKELSLDGADAIKWCVMNYGTAITSKDTPIEVKDVTQETPKEAPKKETPVTKVVLVRRYDDEKLDKYFQRVNKEPWGAFCLIHPMSFIGSCGCSKDLDAHRQRLESIMDSQTITTYEKHESIPSDTGKTA